MKRFIILSLIALLVNSCAYSEIDVSIENQSGGDINIVLFRINETELYRTTTIEDKTEMNFALNLSKAKDEYESCLQVLAYMSSGDSLAICPFYIVGGINVTDELDILIRNDTILMN